MSVPAVSISPLLVASRSPWNCLSMDILPRYVPAEGSLHVRGFSFTSNGPVARVVTIGSLGGTWRHHSRGSRTIVDVNGNRSTASYSVERRLHSSTRLPRWLKRIQFI